MMTRLVVHSAVFCATASSYPVVGAIWDKVWKLRIRHNIFLYFRYLPEKCQSSQNIFFSRTLTKRLSTGEERERMKKKTVYSRQTTKAGVFRV